MKRLNNPSEPRECCKRPRKDQVSCLMLVWPEPVSPEHGECASWCRAHSCTDCALSGSFKSFSAVLRFHCLMSEVWSFPSEALSRGPQAARTLSAHLFFEHQMSATGCVASVKKWSSLDLTVFWIYYLFPGSWPDVIRTVLKTLRCMRAWTWATIHNFLYNCCKKLQWNHELFMFRKYRVVMWFS